MSNGKSNAEEKRENRLKLLEDDIGRHLAGSHASGELTHAPSFGKPLNFGDGYAETPDELRMGMKILKDAGVVPPEVEFMQQIEALRLSLEGAPDDEASRAGRQRLAEMRQQLALRLEAISRSVR
jgi:hypothetical protein